MNGKHDLHTRISTEAMRILERYEKEPGMGCKNVVLEKALLGMNKEILEAGSTDITISKIKIGFLRELLGSIIEGTILGIIGPPASGKTLFACRIIHDFLCSNEKQCVFVSKRNRMSYLIPITNSLGMRLGSFAEQLFLNICEISALDTLYRVVQKSKPKIIAIDDLQTIQENGSTDVETILNSSGWNIFSEEVRNQKMICIVISENKNIIRFCDIAVELTKRTTDDDNIVIVKVVKNIGIIPSVQYKLEILDSVRMIPLQENGIEIIGATPSEKPKNESCNPLKKIAANSTSYQNAIRTETELTKPKEPPEEPIAFRILDGNGSEIVPASSMSNPKSIDTKTKSPEVLKTAVPMLQTAEPIKPPEVPNSSDSKLLKFTESLKKRVDEKKAGREERIVYAILKFGGEIIFYDLQKETGIDNAHIYGVLKNLTDGNWIFDNGQKGKNKIILVNKNKLTKEELPFGKTYLAEKIAKLLSENNGELRQPEIAQRLNLPSSEISVELIKMEKREEIERIGKRGRKGYLVRLISKGNPKQKTNGTLKEGINAEPEVKPETEPIIN